jgi:transposase
MRILAIDSRRSKAVACDYNSISGKYEYQKVPMSPQAINDLLVLRSPDRVVLEVSPTAGWVYDIGRALGIEVQVANANHEAWRWKNVKRKDDRTDALKLAQLSIMNQLPTVHMPEKKVRQKRSLIHYRQKLIKHRTQVKNNIRSILEREGLSMPEGRTAWTNSYL